MSEFEKEFQQANQLIEQENQLEALHVAVEKGVKKSKRRFFEKKTEDGFEEFYMLAQLMNISVNDIKDEFFLFQVKKLMSKLAKAVIRFGVSNKELDKLFHNAKELGLDELVVAPSYLPACAKQVGKLGGDGFKVGALIDFPFGESTVKSKLSCAKDCIKQGVDDITVQMPTMLINKENARQYKKQCKKIGKLYKGRAGVAVNASDLDEEGIKLAVKGVAKTKLDFITFVFGSATVLEVSDKMAIVKKHKEGKKVFALANVDSAEGLMTLFKQDVDKIITPYADEIGLELVKRFKIKSVKLK